MRRVAVRGEQLAFDQVGEGHVDLILVHGFQNDRTVWKPFVERLDLSRFKVTSFDLLGCGHSSPASSWTRCTIDEYATDLATLCRELRIESPIVVGHSLGGGIALRAALRDPTMSAGLVLVAPASTTGLDFVTDEAFESLCHPTTEQRRTLARAAFRHPIPPADLDALLAVLGRATSEHIEGAARSLRDFRCIDDLGRLSTPTLVIGGDRDLHVPLRSHLATQQSIPRCGLHVYFDVGHVPFVEVPDSFASDVVRFVDTVLEKPD